jgi:hypothetical protein
MALAAVASLPVASEIVVAGPGLDAANFRRGTYDRRWPPPAIANHARHRRTPKATGRNCEYIEGLHNPPQPTPPGTQPTLSPRPAKPHRLREHRQSQDTVSLHPGPANRGMINAPRRSGAVCGSAVWFLSAPRPGVGPLQVRGHEPLAFGAGGPPRNRFPSMISSASSAGPSSAEAMRSARVASLSWPITFRERRRRRHTTRTAWRLNQLLDRRPLSVGRRGGQTGPAQPGGAAGRPGRTACGRRALRGSW